MDSDGIAKAAGFKKIARAEMTDETREADLPFTAKQGLGRLQDSYAEFLDLVTDFLERLLSLDANIRRTAVAALALPWLAGSKYS